MSFSRISSSPRSLLVAGLLCLASLLLVLHSGPRAEAADDIDLLRQNGGKPFVMVLVDSSASMSLRPTVSKGKGGKDLGELAGAGSDDPESKLFQVKKALYNVFRDVENVHYGFAAFNQDRLKVKRKHWLYRPLTEGVFGTTLTYPVLAKNGPAGAAPTPREYLESDWVFGSQFNGGVAGSCADPIDITADNGRIRLNRFPKSTSTTIPTELWLTDGSDTYRLRTRQSTTTSFQEDPTCVSSDTVTCVSLPAGGVGDPYILLDLTLERFATCPAILPDSIQTATVGFRRVTDFLMVEVDSTTSSSGDPGVEGVGAVIPGDGYDTSACAAETIAGFWSIQDVAAENTCGLSDTTKPFSGRGWEGNTDSGDRSGFPRLDRCCVDPLDPGVCVDLPDAGSGSISTSLECTNLHFPTAPHPLVRELDQGDFIPPDWNIEYRDDFLKRLNPRHPDAPDPDETEFQVLRQYFGVAPFFEDTPDSDGLLKLKNDQEKPLVAFGNTPLGRAINDFRCFVVGGDGSGKCKGPQFDPGWNALFMEQDLWYDCRAPYFIIISDGEENSVGENPTADVSDFLNAAGFRTYTFTFAATSLLQSISNSGGGELIEVANGDDLETELRKVIGIISQASRTFATAAVPSVQAAVESKIYLTKFQPSRTLGLWEGHLHSFLRPLPTDQTDPPNRNYENWIWDSAEELLDQSSQPAADGDNSSVLLKLGTGAMERRVFYPLDETGGAVPAGTRLFDKTASADASGGATTEEEDFWRGLDIPFDSADLGSVNAARQRANEVVIETLLQKKSTVVSETDDLDWFILGDIFHSSPLVIGAPANTRYFVDDAEETFDGSGVAQGTGYQDFFNRHENRRKVIVAGANDGMFHAFDGGVSYVDSTGDPEVAFSNGSGRELFAYIPRSVMPTVKALAENPSAHRWSVDGSPTAGDVFIDPKHSGSPSASDRAWRTVVIGGLREGGSAYYAVDVTQPDELQVDDVGPDNQPTAQREVMVVTDQATADADPESLKVASCYGKTGDGNLGCDDQLPYPSVLWEFTDQVWDDTDEAWVQLDEDKNEFPDLGETWSKPNIGRIRVIENGALVNKYVAVFGGGLDPAKVESRGNWIYIIDIETGEAIYKRKVEGSIPADAAAIDTDQDSYLDRIYVGTTAGYLYRVDLVDTDNAGNVVYPRLTDQSVQGINGLTYGPVTRIETGTSANPLWAPVQIFDTVTGAGTDDEVRRPIYFPPAVVFVGELGRYALAFGTGDRDDLAARTEQNGRFYVFVDETDLLSDSDIPLDETDLVSIDPLSTEGPDLISDPSIAIGEKGWYLSLGAEERLIGTPFAFSGITFFATFDAEVRPCESSCPSDGSDPLCVECNSELDRSVTQCNLVGISRIYVVGTTDADAFLETSGSLSRYYEIEGQFVTSPFTEQAVGTEKTSGDGSTDSDADPLSDIEKGLVNKLKDLFPRQCKFGNHRIDVKVVQANSEIQRVAAVPICIVEKNWREVNQ